METFSPILTKDKPQLCFFFKPFLTNNKWNESIELVHNVVSLSVFEQRRFPLPSEFKLYDHDKDGKISLSEFAVTLSSTEKASRHVFQREDKDGKKNCNFLFSILESVFLFHQSIKI